MQYGTPEAASTAAEKMVEQLGGDPWKTYIHSDRNWECDADPEGWVTTWYARAQHRDNFQIIKHGESFYATGQRPMPDWMKQGVGFSHNTLYPTPRAALEGWVNILQGRIDGFLASFAPLRKALDEVPIEGPTLREAIREVARQRGVELETQPPLSELHALVRTTTGIDLAAEAKGLTLRLPEGLWPFKRGDRVIAVERPYWGTGVVVADTEGRMLISFADGLWWPSYPCTEARMQLELTEMRLRKVT